MVEVDRKKRLLLSFGEIEVFINDLCKNKYVSLAACREGVFFSLGINSAVELNRRLRGAEECASNEDNRWAQAICGEHGGSVYLRFCGDVTDISIQDAEAREQLSGRCRKGDVLKQIERARIWLNE